MKPHGKNEVSRHMTQLEASLVAASTRNKVPILVPPDCAVAGKDGWSHPLHGGRQKVSIVLTDTKQVVGKAEMGENGGSREGLGLAHQP